MLPQCNLTLKMLYGNKPLLGGMNGVRDLKVDKMLIEKVKGGRKEN